MRRAYWAAVAVVVMVVAAVAWLILSQRGGDTNALQPASDRIALPTPRYDSATSVEEALLKRRSIRDYKDEPLMLAELAQLLWAAQGITDLAGFRTAPSAGALYPMEVYAVVGNVTDLAAGVYKYHPAAHALERTATGDRLAELSKAALGQSAVRDAAVVLVLAAAYERTTQKYGERGVRYVHMEAGHVSQNVYLQAVSLGLGTVTIGAFYDEDVKKVVGLPDNEQPLYLMPVGRP
ncbi:MAG: SagB/ThcOx family dehydrogenase [Anaerolineales bacterium]